MSDFGDDMTFKERSMNFLGSSIFTPFFTQLQNAQTQVFRDHVDPAFPDLIELARRKTELVFVNSVELLDFPRPIMHKVIYIGGIGMSQAKQLDEVDRFFVVEKKNKLPAIIHSPNITLEKVMCFSSLASKLIE